MGSQSKSLTTLLQQSTIDDHEEILKACHNSLKQSKADVRTQHVRFLALLKLDRYEDALQVLDEAGDQLKKRTKTETAYALYKSGQVKEAIDLAKTVENDRGARHVEAQASYRLEEFADAAEIYKGLTKGGNGYENEESDLRINSSATAAQAEWSGKGDSIQRRKHTREDLEAFMTAYNAGTIALSRGELREAEFLLQTAKGLCASTEELTDSEKDAEILPIKVQQLYLLCRLGKNEAAETLAKEITVQEINDAATQLIAQNNLQAALPITNPYASLRLLQSTPPLSKNEHLFDFQSSATERNVMTADLQAFKSGAVIDSTERVIAKEGSTLSSRANSLSVLNAAAHAQSQLAKLGLKQIRPLFSKRPTDIGLAMTIIQLYMLTSNTGAATTVLESLMKNLAIIEDESKRDSLLSAPGLVALQVSLYGLQNRTPQTKSILAKASSYWRHKSKSSPQSKPTALFNAAGLALVSSSDPSHNQEAREIFSTLYREDPTSSFATAGYVAAHARHLPGAHSDIDLSREAKSLPPVSKLIAGIDIDALEAAGVAQPPSKTTTAAATEPSTSRKRTHPDSTTDNPKPGGGSSKPLRKRIRKSRHPKDYDPSKQADPERWLPLRDRSNYRPKGKKGKKRAEDKTQGGAVAEEEGSKVAQTGGTTTTGGSVIQGGGGGGGGGKSKGKKKGKR